MKFATTVNALGKYRVPGTPAEQALDDLTALAVQICGAWIALISLVDEDQHWVKVRVVLKSAEWRRDSFCEQAVRHGETTGTSRQNFHAFLPHERTEQ
jgi:hypothetical protein